MRLGKTGKAERRTIEAIRAELGKASEAERGLLEEAAGTKERLRSTAAESRDELQRRGSDFGMLKGSPLRRPRGEGLT